MLKEKLKNSYLLFDGAMGTYFASISDNTILKCEAANVKAPRTVERIHNEYILAGARAIKTNTFSANTISLNMDFASVKEVIRSGYEIAAETAKGKNVLVFADIGPMPEAEEKEADYEYKRIIDVFLECGASCFLFETFGEYGQVLDCARYIKDIDKSIFILSQYAVSPDGYTRKGISMGEIFKNMEDSGYIDAYGLNCISGPKHIYENLKISGVKKKPLSAMPNAGYPSLVGERTVYNYNAGYFASVMADIYKLGVKILGGCCGTTPEHIALTKKALDESGLAKEEERQPSKTVYIIKKAYNGFRQKLIEGRKAIAVELEPPFNADISKTISGTEELKKAGADIITIADNPLARARADSAIVSARIKRECAIDTLPHITCRDRNLNAIKSALLGLHIEGVRNILAVTGDPVPDAQRNDIKSIYNLNSKMLIGYIRDLNETVFKDDAFFIGAALNVNANKPDLEIKRAQDKIEKGAEFFLTQPVFSPEAIEALTKAKSMLKTRILAGIMPLVSYKNAVFIKNEIPDIPISDNIIAAFEGRSKEDAEKLGVKMALDTIAKISDYTDGYYIITPLNRIKAVSAIIKEIRSAE